MHSPNLANIKHKKLLFIVGLIISLLVGYFAYKYIYIYTERRKYDQATVAIQKVAADLRAQGIETTFSRGCGKNQDVYGFGGISCNTGITLKSTNNISSIKTVDSFKSDIIKHKFILTHNGINTSDNKLNSGTSSFSLPGSKLYCGLTYSSTEETSQFDFGCGNSAKFQLF
jgi:hypothetical protein